MGSLASLKGTSIILGTTIGAGIFSLPFIFLQGGWVLSSIYLLILTFIVFFAHYLFLRIVDSTGKEESLLGIIHYYFGGNASGLGALAIAGGLIMSLIIYIILGSEFLLLIFPFIPKSLAILLVWFVSSFPMFLKKGVFEKIEVLGTVFIAAIIFFIFSHVYGGMRIDPPSVVWSAALIPIGPLLFSLAGWPAIHPFSEALKRNRNKRAVLFVATLLVAILYLLFIFGIFSMTPEVSPNTLSGLDIPVYVLIPLAILGLFAIWTSYIPSSVEAALSLNQVGIRKKISFGTVFILPLLVIASGFDNFIRAVSISGGIFTSAQYIFILLLALKVLKLRGFKRYLSISLIALFVFVAIYEIYYFAFSN